VFNIYEQQLNSEQIIHRIAEEFQLWELARRGGSNDQSQEYTFRRKAVGVCVCVRDVCLHIQMVAFRRKAVGVCVFGMCVPIYRWLH
jgi:hypothetical protein